MGELRASPGVDMSDLRLGSGKILFRDLVKESPASPEIATGASLDPGMEELRQSIGALVPGLLRDGRGGLDLSRIKSKNFSEFKSFLQDQATLNDGFSFRNPFEALLKNEKYEPLLKALYLASRGDEEAARIDAALLRQFHGELLEIDVDRFVQRHFASSEGRQKLRGYLSETRHFRKEARSELVKAIARASEQHKTAAFYQLEGVTQQISLWNYFNWFVSDEELTKASLAAEDLLSAADYVFAKQAKIEAKEKRSTDYRSLLAPEYAGWELTEADWKHHETLAAQSAQDPVGKVRGQLACLWLLAANHSNWRKESAGPQLEGRGHVLRQVEALLRQSEGIQDAASFERFNEALQGFLNREIQELAPIEESAWDRTKRELLAEAKHQTVGNGLEELFEALGASKRSAYDDLRRISDEYKHAMAMGEKISLSPRAASDPKLQGLISALETTKLQLWHGYKQHKALSRGISNVADAFAMGDIADIKAANQLIEATIQGLSKEGVSQEERGKVLSDLQNSLKKDGALYRGFAAAEMDGVEQLLGLVQTIAVTAGTAMLTKGAGTLVQGDLALLRLTLGARALRMVQGFGLGMQMTTAENALALASGEARQGPETAGKWFKDAVSTGAAMALSGLMHIFSTGREGVIKNLWARYTLSGIQGARNFLVDTGLEAVEELVDQYTRQVLDGKTQALTWQEFHEIVSLSLAGGGLKVATAREAIRSPELAPRAVGLASKPTSEKLVLAPLQRWNSDVSGTGVVAAAIGLTTFLQPSIAEAASAAPWDLLGPDLGDWVLKLGGALASGAASWMGWKYVQRKDAAIAERLSKTDWSEAQKKSFLELYNSKSSLLTHLDPSLFQALAEVERLKFKPEVQYAMLSAMLSQGTSSPIRNLGDLIETFLCLEEVGAPPEQIGQLLYPAVTKIGHRNMPIFGELREAAKALAAHGIGWPRIFSLLMACHRITGKSHDYFEALARTLSKWKALGLDRNAGLELIQVLLDRKGAAAYMALSQLAENWSNLEKTDFTAEQKLALLLSLGGRQSLRLRPLTDELRVVIPKLEALGWDRETQYRFLIGFEAESGREVDIAFHTVPMLVTKMKDRGWARVQIEVVIAAVKAPGVAFPGTALEVLSKFMDVFEELSWSPAKQLQTMQSLLFKSKESFSIAANLFFRLRRNDGWSTEQALDLIERLLEPLSVYNRGGVLMFVVNHLDYLRGLGPGNLQLHLNLYLRVLQRWPRLGFNILEDLVDATRQGLIPQDPTAEEERIFQFISRTHRLVPAFYRVYLREGEAFLLQLDDQIARILQDVSGLPELERIAKERGDDYLLGLLHMASPTTGISFVAKADHQKHLKKMLEAGDLRKDLPMAWRGQKENFEIGELQWRLKSNAVLDPEGRIAALLTGFQNRNGEPDLSPEDLRSALEKYLQSERGAKERSKFRALLSRFAGQNPALWERIYHLHSLDRSQLSFLEELFSERDQLPGVLRQVIEQVPQELLRPPVKATTHPFYNFDKFIQNLMQVGRQPEDKRRKILPRLLQSVDPALADSLLLGREEFSEEFKGELREAIQAVRNGDILLSPGEIAAEILNRDLADIRVELNKYRHEEVSRHRIGIRPVKGPGFSLWALTAGVCVANDMGVWKNPQFKLFAITDEVARKAVGYVQIVETQVDGKKYLALPGINPSAEFLASVDAKKFYDGLMEQIVAFAKRGNFSGVLIPTEPVIFSNRTEIQRVVQRSLYPLRRIPEVRWNQSPRPYPFQEVYVAWEAE